MKTAIIIFSETGHTLSVGNQIRNKIIGSDLFEIMVTRPNKNNRLDFSFDRIPNVEDYDNIVFGSFVEGFQLNPVMKRYIEDQDLKGKKIICFLTHYFPFKWMGGVSAMKQMVKAVEDNKGEILLTGIIDWTNHKRQSQIDELVIEITNKLLP